VAYCVRNAGAIYLIKFTFLDKGPLLGVEQKKLTAKKDDNLFAIFTKEVGL
jgi:hypothetical protein